ncbi:MAG: OmpA family protein [Myxococcales bacterium]|nr:OmpA family protein [Myxococcales bacterium]
MPHATRPARRARLTAWTAAGLTLLLGPPLAAAQETWLINAHGTAVHTASEADATPGGALGAGLYRSLSPTIQIGGRLGGTLIPVANGDDPLMLGTLTGQLRVRPFADPLDARRGTGLYLEAGAGPALAGDRVTGAVDAAVGYTFAAGDALAIGPGVRYLHAFEGDARAAGRDVQAIMFGLELAALDAVDPPGWTGEATLTDAAPGPAAASVASDADADADADADRVADRFDRCPDAAETHNGVNDHDGCPDDGALALDHEAPRVVVDELLFFDRGAATLTARGAAALDDIAALYRDGGPRALILRGHVEAGADRQGAGIVEARAAAIRDGLVERGVPARAIFTEVYPAQPMMVAQVGDRRMEFVFDE